MAAPRQMPARGRSVALALAVSLLVKLLVPTGWMPVFDGRHIWLEMCGSFGPPPPAMQEAMAEAAHRMAGHDDGSGNQRDKTSPDQPCAYAGLSFAALDAFVQPLAPPPIVAVVLVPAMLMAAVGRGLAAPPPPSTGPPSLT